MSMKTIPCSEEKMDEIIAQYPTPFHLYDERAILENARTLKEAFAWNEGFKEYFAVKAAPNPYLLKLLKAEGFGADCSSGPELMLAEKVGITGENIMFTSNDTPATEYRQAVDLGAIINLDDISHISFLEESTGLPDTLSVRYNPGALKEGNEIIGHPEEAKYGFTTEQLFEGFTLLREKGVKRFGLHTMVASNELNLPYFLETARILFEAIVDISQKVGIRFDFVNLGGGVGIPYRPEDEAIDLQQLGAGIRALYQDIIMPAGLTPLKICMECGRMITGPYGYLVSKVRHIKKTYKTYAGLDSCMTDLMRPALYGAYHHITILGKNDEPADQIYDVTGSLCENNDKFAIDRALPLLTPGDVVILHDTGAHGHAMGFNYNGKLRSAELLLRTDGSVVPIRRAETTDDLFATLDFSNLNTFE